MWDVFVVFIAQVIYVSMMTLRWILLMKGQRYQAAGLSVIEVIIWVYALGLVVGNLHNPARLLAYAVGYGVGSLVGTWLEARLAFGYMTVQVIAPAGTGLSQALRERGFGVTTWRGSGRDGDREIIMVVARRRWGKQLYEVIDSIAPQAFVLAIEPRGFRGGFMTRRLLESPMGATGLVVPAAGPAPTPPPPSQTDPAPGPAPSSGTP